MSVAAAMDDLRRKLAALVNTKAAAIDPQINTASQQIESLFAQQQAFESNLIDLCEKASVITPAEAAKLKLLLKLRHLCAHPSGHAGTAEEARECISSLVDIVFSRPPLMGLTGVTELLQRLKGVNFFPSISDQAKTVAASKTELDVLLPGSIPALAAKLVDEMLTSARAVAASQGKHPLFPLPEQRNYREFAYGMLSYGEPARKAIWRNLNKLIEEPSAIEDALYILYSNPTGLALANPLTRERALSVVRRHLNVQSARFALRGWLQAKALSAEEEAEMLQACKATLLERWSSNTSGAVADIAWPTLERLYFDTLVENAGSSTWDVANPAISAIQEMPSDQAARFSPKQQVDYLLNVARNALSAYSPKSARPLLKYGLGERAAFIDSLVSHYAQVAQAGQPEFEKFVRTDWQALAQMLVASGRLDAVIATIDFITADFTTSKMKFFSGDVLQMLAEFKGHPDPKVANAAQTALSFVTAEKEE